METTQKDLSDETNQTFVALTVQKRQLIEDLLPVYFDPQDGTTTPPQEKRHGQKAPSLTFFPLFFRRSVVNSELITRELERGHVAQVKQPIYNTCLIFFSGLKTSSTD